LKPLLLGVVGPLDLRPQGGGPETVRLQVGGDLVGGRGQPGQGAPQGLGLDRGEGGGVGRQLGQGAVHRLDGGRLQAVGGRVAGPLGHAEQGQVAAAGPGRAQVGLLEAAPGVVQHRPLVGLAAGEPVHHHQQRHPPGLGLAQELPGHGVGVALGGGHEQAQVGRLEQLLGGAAVLGLHRVDVGGVDQGDLGEGAVVDDQLEAVGVGQGGQHLAGHEGVDLAGGEQHHRPHGGRPDHPAGAHPGPGEPVEQRRLPGPGGAEQDADQRCLQVADPGQQVVVQVPGQPPAPGRPQVPGDGGDGRGRGHLGGQAGQGRLQGGRVDSGGHGHLQLPERP
jgi:hypothetical protein